MQPGPELAKNKPKWKETNKKKPTKRRMKSYTTGVKRYWMAWSVKHKKKRKFTSQPSSEERSTYFTFSEIQITPKEDMAVNSLFLIILRPNYQLEHYITQERKKWIQSLLCIGSNSPWFKLVFLLAGNDMEQENEILHNKNISWNQCHFAYSTESFR